MPPNFNGKFGIGGAGDVFFWCGGVNQYARLLGLFTMQGDTDFKDKVKTFNNNLS
jgi:hypothetical protein